MLRIACSAGLGTKLMPSCQREARVVAGYCRLMLMCLLASTTLGSYP